MTPSETTLAKNKDIVRAFVDALFTKGDLGAVDKYLAEDFVDHDPPFDAPGDREGIRAAGALFRKACPDWRSEVHLMIAEGDLVVEHFTASGTQRGELLGVLAPAEGRPLTLRGTNIFRVRGGHIVERWGRPDELGILTQLGLAPSQT